jgi:tRNA threonylcarbamoyladenosine biosynthesis protein TsaB
MNVLAVDTAAEAMSVALRAGGKTFAYHKRLVKPHDETIQLVVDKIFARAGVTPQQLDAIIAASGPGRFTGIRVGMAYAAVLAGRLGVPALAVSRLEGLAAGEKGKFTAVIEGWRGEKFIQDFVDGKPIAPPRWVSGCDLPVQEPRASQLLNVYVEAGRPFEPLYLKPASYERPTGKKG